MEYGQPIAFDIETKAVAERDDAWVVTGYASVFGNRDLGGDVVVKGAFKKSLEQHGMPALLWNHKHDEPPLGNVVDAREHERGLWVKCELPRDDTFVAGRVIPQLKKRVLKGMSIGFKVLEREQRGDTRYLKSIRLYEVSVVNQPMNPLAEIETVKNFDPAALDVVGRTLDEVARELWSLARRDRRG
jgi:HK97 family phage prohead protease